MSDKGDHESLIQSGQYKGYSAVEVDKGSGSDKTRQNKASTVSNSDHGIGKISLYCKNFAWIIVAIVVILPYLSKGVFVCILYWISKCPNSTDSMEYCVSTDSKEICERKKKFSALIQGFITLLYIVQYLIVIYSARRYLCKCKGTQNQGEREQNRFQKIRKQWERYLQKYIEKTETNSVLYLCAVTLGLQVSVSLAVPIVGIIMETHYQGWKSCGDQTCKFVYMYFTMDIVTKLIDIVIGVSLMLAVLGIRSIWFPNVSTEDAEAVSPIKVEQKEPSNDIWQEIAADYHRVLMDIYAEKGEKNLEIVAAYEMWFLIPWIIYALASTISIYEVLRPWDKQHEFLTLPSVYYFLFMLQMFLQILLAYIMAVQTDRYAQSYRKLMRDFQLNTDIIKKNSVALSYARQFKIEEKYGFTVKLGVIDVSTTVESPLFIVTFLWPILVTSLHKVNML